MKYLEKETEFQNLIKGDVVVVDFFATWCGPCQMISPVLEQLEKENEKLQVVKIDVDKHEQLARKHNVISIPMLEIYKKEKLVDTIVGYVSKEELEDLIK